MKTLLIPYAVVSLATAVSAAPIPLTGSMHYTQNFDVLATATNGSTSSTTWADDSTIPGWTLYKASTGPVGATYTYRVSDGIAGVGNANGLADTGHFYSIGALNSIERALGAVSITAQGEHSCIAIFENTTGTDIKLTNIFYNAELRRTNQTANVVETIAVWWRKDTLAANLLNNTTATATVADWPADKSTTPSGPYITGWNRLLQADFTTSSPNANTQVTTNVNTPVNAAVSDVTVGPGEFLAVRWGNINDAGADAVMGIDDVDLTFESATGGIAGQATNIVRQEANTPRVPTDDTVSFNLEITNTGGGGAGWVVTAPAGLAGVSGVYGIPAGIAFQSIGLFTGPTHTMTITVADSTNNAVTTNVRVNAPWGTITPAPASNFAYLDKGTADASDDEVTYRLNADGVYTGAEYTAGAAGNSPYGTPLTVTAAAPGTYASYAFVDSADPALTATLDVFPPAIIGTDATTLSPKPLLSLPVAQNGAIHWTANGVAKTLVQTANPVQGDHVLTSEVVDISTAADVEFKATLVASTVGGTSGFEAPDSFALDLIIDGVTVSALGTSDTNGDGRLAGTVELSATAGISTTFNFTHVIPAAANSVQVKITGNSNSPQETYTISGLELSIPQPAISLSAASNIVRNPNGPGLADDTVSFDVTVTGINGGTGWTTTNALPASGVFGPVTFTVPAGGNSATVRITDNTFPAAFADVTVSPLPGPYIIGTVDLGAGSSPVFTDSALPPDAAWVLDSGAGTISMTDGDVVVAGDKTVTSEVISLAGAGTAVNFSANLHVHDKTAGFEAADTLLVELILDGGAVPSIRPTDFYDADFSGRMDGAELCPVPAVNPTVQDFDYPLTAVIPAGVSTVQLVITGLCDSANETMTLSGIAFAKGQADADGDGMSDAYEDANGLDKNSAADKDLDLDGDGQTNYLEFLAGTTANSAGSFLHVIDGTLNAATGAGSTTWSSVAGKRYRVQLSGDLADWTDAGNIITADGPTTTASYTIPGAPLTGKGFLRVKVVP